MQFPLIKLREHIFKDKNDGVCQHDCIVTVVWMHGLFGEARFRIWVSVIFKKLFLIVFGQSRNSRAVGLYGFFRCACSDILLRL